VDGLGVAIRTDKGVLKKCVYTVLGLSVSGRQEVLGLWVEETEGARFWLKVFNDLKARGVQDILVVCGDGLTGLPEAVRSAFPVADVQLCVVHQIRNATKFVSYKDRKAFCADMRPTSTAPTIEAAELALDRFAQTWGARYPMFGGKLAPALGRSHCVLQISRRVPAPDLHHQRHRKSALSDAEEDCQPQDVSQ
jgi:transposase-like protein